MNALVKKEIRLLLPSWIVAVLLAMVQGITRPYDFYVASLLFFGLTLMALSTIGRETSLNTFSSLLALPAERVRIWQTKLSVLAAAFLTVFIVWLAAFGIAFINSNVDADDRENSYNLFITICLIATATFTGGLWTTLLLRQIAGAFWLTLLVPATLSGFSGIFLADSESSSLVIAVLSVVIAVYSVAGFLFARRLFFRAQDVGWSGGVIALPEWKIFARPENAVSTRCRKPIFALLKKEFQLQQASLMGAVGLVMLHLGIIVLRKYHHFAKDSAGEVLTSVFWMVWLVMAPVIGAMAVAEERRLGVMEGQLCLPVSRRVQFAIKTSVTLLLGMFLGGVMPMLLETIGLGLGAHSAMFTPESNAREFVFSSFQSAIVALAAWLALVSFFASTLARSFLQAIGMGLATFVGFMLLIPAFTTNRMFVFDSISRQSLLPLVITVPTIVVTLFWLAYLNYKNFHPGWPLWRRHLIGFAGAVVFIMVASIAIYHRAWEVFEPAEPAHGLAKFSMANPPVIHHDEGYEDDFLVQLPDGRFWFDRIGYSHSGHFLRDVIRSAVNPSPASIGPQRFVSGSNWVSAAVLHFVYGLAGQNTNIFVYLDTVGIQSDGTLWVSDKSGSQLWTGDRLAKFGEETNWQALGVSQLGSSVLLLKKDGTLWRWGTNQYDLQEGTPKRPVLRGFNPYRIGTNSDWKRISYSGDFLHLQKADGSVWSISEDPKNGKDRISRSTNWDQVDLEKIPQNWSSINPFVRKDGSLWIFVEHRNSGTNSVRMETFQSGKDTNWVSVAMSWTEMVALKSDGTLWQWGMDSYNRQWSFADPPTRLGIHNDWVAIASVQNDVVALAADGSLWLWPSHDYYNYEQALLKLPKQPQRLGNVFSQTD